MKAQASHQALIPLFGLLLGLGLLAPRFAAAQNNGGPVSPQDELRSIAPNVYLDCDRRTCDFDYIKTEITFVNYVPTARAPMSRSSSPASRPGAGATNTRSRSSG